MKIAIVSTWNECCGIAEYTKDLVYGLREKGHSVHVFANFPKLKAEPDEEFVTRCFHVPYLDNIHETDISFVEQLLQYDIVHFQFETSLYHPAWFPNLVKELFGKVPIVFTMHSSGIWPNFDQGFVSRYITHEPMPWYSNSAVIPMGIKFYDNTTVGNPKYIVSFGLGRNNDDFVRKAITGTEIEFYTTYGHHKWLSKQDLVKEIQRAFSVSLIYPPVGASVSSSAANLALGCHRVLFCSPTNWFKHVNHYPAVYSVDTTERMKEIITDIAESNDYQSDLLHEIASRKDYICNEGRDYDTFVNRHITVYKNLL